MNLLAPETWPLVVLVVAFVLLTGVILVGGTALTRKADEIATVTGISAALIGGMLLGATTSLSGTIVSISTAFQGHSDLAIGNAIGGIVVQTAFLAVADFFHRRGNLEYAAASVSTLMQAMVLIGMLSLPIVAMNLPPLTFFAIHPLSVVLILGYMAGMRLVDRAEQQPMWRPTPTVPEQRGDDIEMPQRAPWLGFFMLIPVAAGAGYGLAEVGVALSSKTGLSQTAVGAAFTAVVTSLPELVTAVAAVRRGALQLAMSGIIGGNAYDVLFLSLSDAAYREGSLYHAFNADHVLLISISIMMTAIIALGMLKRDRFGPADIGFESALVLLLYAASLLRLFVGG